MKLPVLLLLGLFTDLAVSLSTKVAATRPQLSGCGGSCGGGSSHNSGYKVAATRPQLSGCGGRCGGGSSHNSGYGSASGEFSSGCGSRGCGLGSSYVSSSNPCSSGGCYSGCGSGGCSGSTGFSSGGYSSGGSGCSSGRCSGSTGLSSGGYSSGGSGGFGGSSGCGFGGCSGSSGYNSGSSGCGLGGCGVNPLNHRNCQCDWLFNSHGQGNCNVGGSGYTKDRWCYIDPDVNGRWVEPGWACPDAVASTEYEGKFWSRVACDTPKPGQSVHKK